MLTIGLYLLTPSRRTLDGGAWFQQSSLVHAAGVSGICISYFSPSTILVVGVSNISTHIYSQVGECYPSSRLLAGSSAHAVVTGRPPHWDGVSNIALNIEDFYQISVHSYSLNLDTLGFLHFWDATPANMNEKSMRYEKYFIFNLYHRSNDVL